LGVLKEFLQVGQIRKGHGLDGLLKMTLRPEFQHVTDQIDHFFVEDNGQKLPLFIEYYEQEGGDLIIKFEDIDNPQDATQLAAKALFMDKAVLAKLIDYTTKEKDLPFDYADLIGYKILDITMKEELEILDIYEYPQQIMANIEINGKEILLPLSDNLIKKIDHGKKVITTEFPEGIFEL